MRVGLKIAVVICKVETECSYSELFRHLIDKVIKNIL